MAAAFYEHRPGDEFELDDPRFARLAGTVAERTIATADRRRLAAIEIARVSEAGRCVRTGDEFHLEQLTPTAPPSVLGLPDVRALLTPEQYRLIASDRERPLIIQGRAGSGKTTVALYRVAYLAAPEAAATGAPLDPHRVLIVMFNRALQQFVERSLADVELGAATIDTFHGWALARIRRAYKGDLEIDPTPTAEAAEQGRVTAIKKRLGILAAIDEFVGEQEQRMVLWLTAALQPYRAVSWVDEYRESSGPVVRRLMDLRSKARLARDAASGPKARREAQRLTEIHKVLHAAVGRMTQYKDELLRLFTGTALLAKHLPEVSRTDLAELANYQLRLQRKDPGDRKAGPRIHFDDLAPLLRLIVCKHGGLPDAQHDESVDKYDHLMIDEAQDFGAVELGVLLSIVRSRTGVTVVGDVNQKIVPAADFMGWDELARELGLDGAAVARLEVGHRSSARIMAVADTLTGDTTTAPGRPGPMPRLHCADTPARAHEILVAEVLRLASDHGQGHVAVVTHDREAAASLAATLAREVASHRMAIAVRHGHNKHFTFEPGVTVTNVAQVKGLEFDAVVVLEPTESAYPAAGEQGRRRLYTVMTRAKFELVFIASDEPSALLKPAMEAGLVDVVEPESVPAFETLDDDPF